VGHETFYRTPGKHAPHAGIYMFVAPIYGRLHPVWAKKIFARRELSAIMFYEAVLGQKPTCVSITTTGAVVGCSKNTSL